MPWLSRELTTFVTTTTTTAGLTDAFSSTMRELVSCLVTPSACVYGSEGRGSNPGYPACDGGDQSGTTRYARW